MGDFIDFIKDYFEAIRNEDEGFIRKVYKDWFGSSGVLPKEQEDFFFNAIFGDLKQLLDSELKETESYDGFYVAHMVGGDGTGFTLSFTKKGDSFIFFNERTNFTSFQQVYALNYDVKGGRLRILFNGKRVPTVEDVQNSGFHSMINSALKVGENEITLQSPDGAELQVSLRISKGKEGEVMDSSQGDVLSWDGQVKEPVSLRFDAQ